MELLHKINSLHRDRDLLTSRNEELLVDEIRLIRSENIGTKTFINLINLYGSASKAIEAIPELSRRGGRLKPVTVTSKSSAIEEIEKCQKIGAEIISYRDINYPTILRQISDFPPLLTILGNKSLLNQPIVAIVGAREASANGCNFAYRLASDLGNSNIIVASGLARGIDTYAHRGSLTTGTIAVIAGGIDYIYPPENEQLYQNIKENGVIIAELPFGSVPRSQNFPQRNRIISGISQGVAVIEASFGSGSLITARMAIEQNRDLFAAPGFPLDPRCKGTNNLIKQGAKLLESAKDIIDEINFPNNPENNFAIPVDNSFSEDNLSFSEDDLIEARKNLFKFLGASPIDLNELIRISGYKVNIVLTVILELELADKIERFKGNKIAYKFE